MKLIKTCIYVFYLHYFYFIDNKNAYLIIFISKCRIFLVKFWLLFEKQTIANRKLRNEVYPYVHNLYN